MCLSCYTLANIQTPKLYTGDTGEIELFGYLLIDIWDHDKVNPDDFLGRVVVPLCDILPGSSGETTHPIKRKVIKESVSGSLRFN